MQRWKPSVLEGHRMDEDVLAAILEVMKPNPLSGLYHFTVPAIPRAELRPTW